MSLGHFPGGQFPERQIPKWNFLQRAFLRTDNSLYHIFYLSVTYIAAANEFQQKKYIE